jgi:glycosyltransferase involved in cell wall biosynthesis
LDILGDAGIAFRSKDIEDLTLQINWVTQSTPAAAALGERARDRVRTLYSWDTVTTELVSLYQRAIESSANTVK